MASLTVSSTFPYLQDRFFSPLRFLSGLYQGFTYCTLPILAFGTKCLLASRLGTENACTLLPLSLDTVGQTDTIISQYTFSS